MHKYDYSFLKDYKITSKLLGLSNVIAESNYRTSLLEQRNPNYFNKLHEKAVIESTISSSRIEGVVTSPKREKELLNTTFEPINHDEQEISGYKDAIIFISNNYDDISIDEKTIKYLHSLLMFYTPRGGGEYKKTDNVISLKYEDGTSKVIFYPVSSDDTESHMKMLCKAYNDAYEDEEINKLLLIPCFIVDFLAIHPFKDGNGRISRLLTLLLLYKEGYKIGKYISYEKMIEEYKWNYYQAINNSQTNWHDNKNDYADFIIFHFQMLYRCYKNINEDLLVSEEENNLSKKQRIAYVLKNSVLPISKAEIANKLLDISITTIENELSQLQKKGLIKKLGNYKDAKYKWI